MATPDDVMLRIDEYLFKRTEDHLKDALQEYRRLCPICGDHLVEDDDAYLPVCRACGRTYPASLLKASADPFDYALQLRNGAVIHFNTCTINGDWVFLDVKPHGWFDGLPTTPFPFPFERGVDVRVDDIVWCADAPYGS